VPRARSESTVGVQGLCPAPGNFFYEIIRTNLDALVFLLSFVYLGESKYTLAPEFSLGRSPLSLQNASTDDQATMMLILGIFYTPHAAAPIKRYMLLGVNYCWLVLQ